VESSVSEMISRILALFSLDRKTVQIGNKKNVLHLLAHNGHYEKENRC